jgi:predicted Rossmann-fold nucleotide-binding protein
LTLPPPAAPGRSGEPDGSRDGADAVEVESLDALDRALAGTAPLGGLRLQGLDLRGRAAALLRRTDLEGLVVLGGQLTPELEHHLRRCRALIFPTDPHAPVDPYRATLYRPQELYAGLTSGGYAATPDALAYRWSRDAASRRDAFVTLLRAIHDDSMSDALDELVADRSVVGVMGGHAVDRGTPRYAEAAHLGAELARAGFLVATGGGPGAMEAANLGAFSRDRAALDAALRRLAAAPSFVPDVTTWASLALEVREGVVPREDGAPRSVGVPTWFYGHEPPNVFVDAVAKFFSNAVREDGLLARCNAGVIVLPGAAGTVQEIFQAATRLYYARERLPPLVLVGRDHWSRVVPVWPTLSALGADRSMSGAIRLVDAPEEALELLTRSR